MQQIDTTNPQAHASARPLFNSLTAAHDLMVSSRLSIRLVGLYTSEVGPEWSSDGRRESDFLHHIELPLSGCREVVFGDDKHLLLEPGQAYFLPGNTPQERRCSEICTLLFIKFRCEWLPGVDPLLDWVGRVPRRIGPFNPADWQVWLAPQPQVTANTLLTLHGTLETWLAQAVPDLAGLIAGHLRSHAPFQAVFSQIESDLGADLRVETLARIHGTSRDAFCMAFSRSIGLSPKDYLNRRLNQEAVNWIINSDLKIKEVAERLRFSDEFYFSRFFRRQNGISPQDYRKHFRPGDRAT